MGLLDIIRAAVPGAAAARVGYNQGQANRQAIDAAAAKQAKAEQRQTLLDKMKAEIDQANLDQTRAETEKLRRPDKPVPPQSRTTERGTEEWDGTKWTVTVPKAKEPPKTRSTNRGIEEFDVTTGTWKVTGQVPYRAPARPTATRPATGKTSTERHLDRVERQIDDNRRDIAAEDNLNEPDSVRFGNLRTRAESLSKVRDSLATEVGRSGAPAPAPSGGNVPKLTPVASDPDVQDVVAEIRKGGLTLKDALRTSALTAEQKRAVQRLVSGPPDK